jgi:hypothetical protein
MQILAPISQGMLQAGRPELFNALLEDWGKAMNVDVTRYMVPPPPPPPPPEGPPNANPG